MNSFEELMAELRDTRRAKKYTDAFELCDAGIGELKLNLSRLLTERAFLEEVAGILDHAIDFTDKAISLTPNHRPAYNRRMIIRTKLEMHRDAIDDAKMLIELDKSTADKPFTDFANVYAAALSKRIGDVTNAQRYAQAVKSHVGKLPVGSEFLDFEELRKSLAD